MSKTPKIEISKTENVKKYSFGREKISIPLTRSTISKETLQKYLPRVLDVHKTNALEYERLEKVVRGEGQEILLKERKDKEKANNTVLENHALAITVFKQGYMFGNAIKYSLANEDRQTTELNRLSEFFVDLEKNSLDNEMAYSLYVGGVANRLILPAIPTEEEISPFQIYDLEYTSSFVVYSSNYKKEKLFGGVISQIDEETDEIIIYTINQIFTFYRSRNAVTNELTFKKVVSHTIGYIPIVEYVINQARIGSAETVESILDSANKISSDCIDNVNDFVNAIFYVKNMVFDKEAYKEVKEEKTLELLTTDPTRPAEAGYLTNRLDLTDVQNKYESLLTSAYDIVGVPRSQQVTSGGDTGEARLLGGGWTKAEIVAQQEENSLVKAERELLKIVLSICKKVKSSNISDLQAKDINIIFTRNISTNLLVKTQSLSTLVAMKMPKEDALNIVQLTTNPHEVAKDWDRKVIEEQERELELDLRRKELGAEEKKKPKKEKFISSESAGTPLHPSNAPNYQ